MASIIKERNHLHGACRCGCAECAKANRAERSRPAQQAASGPLAASRSLGNQATQQWLSSVIIQGRLGASSADDDSETEPAEQDAGAAQSSEDVETRANDFEDLTIIAQPGKGANAGAPATPANSPTASCPYTAELMGFVLGASNTTCTVPAGYNGASRLAQYRVSGAPSQGSLTVTEKFTVLDDPYGVFAALKPNSNSMTGGRFNDCYSLYTKSTLPPDFVLKVEQNHIIGNDIISKNKITFTANSVHVCSHPRLPGSCDFSKRCK